MTSSLETERDFWFPRFKNLSLTYNTPTTTVLRPFFRDHPGEPVPEENFWTLWCKGRSTEADKPTIWLGATPSRLTSAHLHHPPFFMGLMPFLPPDQWCQSTEGTYLLRHLTTYSPRPTRGLWHVRNCESYIHQWAQLTQKG